MDKEPPILETKTFDSFFHKTWRKNILDNTNFPKEPPGGWILPNNWFSKVNDIVRTMWPVKYLDGVEFMIEKITSLCEEHGIECPYFYEAKEEGYYAVTYMCNKVSLFLTLIGILRYSIFQLRSK